MLGAIIGDIVGSAYEFHNYRAKDFQPLFHAKASFTDDTVCTVAVADALINGRNPAASLRDWGRRYWDNGGCDPELFGRQTPTPSQASPVPPAVALPALQEARSRLACSCRLDQWRQS